MSGFSVLLPPPVSTNNLFVNVNRQGKRTRVRSQAYRDWQKFAALTVRLCASKIVFKGETEVFITIDNLRMDIDNVPKAILDLVTALGIWPNDKCVRRLVIERGGKDGLVVLTIRDWGDSEMPAPSQTHVLYKGLRG